MSNMFALVGLSKTFFPPKQAYKTRALVGMQPGYFNETILVLPPSYGLVNSALIQVVYTICCLGPFLSEHTSGWGGWGWRGDPYSQGPLPVYVL